MIHGGLESRLLSRTRGSVSSGDALRPGVAVVTVDGLALVPGAEVSQHRYTALVACSDDNLASLYSPLICNEPDP